MWANTCSCASPNKIAREGKRFVPIEDCRLADQFGTVRTIEKDIPTPQCEFIQVFVVQIDVFQAFEIHSSINCYISHSKDGIFAFLTSFFARSVLSTVKKIADPASLPSLRIAFWTAKH